MDDDLQLSVRSIVLGGVTGSILTASNIYFGLKIGWGFGSSLFTALTGFWLVKMLLKTAERFNWSHPELTRKSSPKELCVLQTAGSAAGGLSAGFVSAIPALALFGKTFSFGALLAWTAASAFLGFQMAVPLRRQAIIEQGLKFPTGTATAETITAMHSAGDAEAMDKASALFKTFGLSLGWHVLTYFVKVLYSWPIFKWFGAPGVAQWNWNLTFSGAFVGAGSIMGLRVTLSFFVGSFIAWAIIGPAVLAGGLVHKARGYSDSIEEPSAQFWLLWVGVSMMIGEHLVGIVMLAHKIFVKSKSNSGPTPGEIELDFVEDNELPHQGAVVTTDGSGDEEGGAVVTDGDLEDTSSPRSGSSAGLVKRSGSTRSGSARSKTMSLAPEKGVDPIPAHEQVPRKWWTWGVVVSGVYTIIVVSAAFGVEWYAALLAVLLSGLWCYIGAQSVGQTDINPLGAIAKLSQLLFAGMGISVVSGLMAANIAAAAASSGADMLQDLRAGVNLGASPRKQYFAQAWGSLFGIFTSVATYSLFNSVYDIPCSDEAATCTFPAPAAQAWYAVALVLDEGMSTLPPYSTTGALIGLLLGGLAPILHMHVPEKYEPYFPSISAFSIAFIVPPDAGVSFLMGTLLYKAWVRRNPDQAEKYLYPVSSGVMAGEGIAGVLAALFSLMGMDGWTTAAGT